MTIGEGGEAEVVDESGEDPKRFDFGFAFNNADFADRIVKLRILPDNDAKSDDLGEISDSDSLSFDSSEGRTTSFFQSESASGPDQAASMSSVVAPSPSAVCIHGTSGRIISLHLSSVVLAAKSSFFRTLFTCGLKEACNNNPVVLNVTSEEEGPVIDLLRFIYTGDMQEPSNNPEDIIKMYLVADKFGVTSGMKICLERLVSLPMTVPTACLYLSLPDSMHTHRGVFQLLEASRTFLVSHFRDLEKVHRTEEFLDLPLVGLQTLLSSDDLNVRDELTAFHAMLEWLRHHHEDMEDRKRTAIKLAENVRFPLMTGDDLEEVVLKAPEIDTPECQALVREAAWFRAYSLVRRLRLMNETATIHRRFWQRRWNRNSVGHVYFDIHLERFQQLAVAATVESATFGIGGKRFYLSARHGRRDDGTETLDIHLHLENSHSVQPEIQVSFIFYAKRWPEGQFDYLRDRVTKGFGRNASNWGYSNILGRPWVEVVQDDSKYFNNGVMSVFAEVQILEQDASRVPSTG